MKIELFLVLVFVCVFLFSCSAGESLLHVTGVVVSENFDNYSVSGNTISKEIVSKNKNNGIDVEVVSK